MAWADDKARAPELSGIQSQRPLEQLRQPQLTVDLGRSAEQPAGGSTPPGPLLGL